MMTDTAHARPTPRPLVHPLAGQDYAAFLHAKVRSARADVAAGRSRPHEAVAAEFAARRTQALGRLA